MKEGEHLIRGRVALVTGGGTGIGKAIALALAQVGARVAVCGRRQAPLTDVSAQIDNLGQEAFAFTTDVASEKEVGDLIDSIQSSLGPIDILVNNAGIGGGSQIHEHDVHLWDQVMQINLRGPFLLARAVLPSMRRRKYGHIINISSESGIEHYRGNGAYGVSKHALNALGEYMQRENQEYNIRVNTICPGMVITEMTEDAVGLDHSKCLQPADIADLVLWLLTRRDNVKVGTPILIQTMLNPWEG